MGNFLFRLFTGMHAKVIKITKGRIGGSRVLALTHKGAKSGVVRDTPLMFFKEYDDYLVIASAGGAPRHPGWYHNVIANPETTITVGGQTLSVTARDAGAERDALWDKIVGSEPRFGTYAEKTDRTIPIVVLSPR